MKIVKVLGREVYDACGWPTIQTELWLDDGHSVTGTAPTDRSFGWHKKNGVLGSSETWFSDTSDRCIRKDIEIIERIIAPALLGQEPRAPELDYLLLELDGTNQKSCLGINVLLATSIASYKAYAHSEHIELYELFAHLTGAESVTIPCPQFTILTHETPTSGMAETNACISNFLITPIGSATLRGALETCTAVFHELKDVLHTHKFPFGLSECGSLTANFKNDQEPLNALLEAIENVCTSSQTLERPGACILAIDMAANRLYDSAQKKYRMGDKLLPPEEVILFYEQLIQEYPIYSIENGLSYDDALGWQLMAEALDDKVQLVVDDSVPVNPETWDFFLKEKKPYGTQYKTSSFWNRY